VLDAGLISSSAGSIRKAQGLSSKNPRSPYSNVVNAVRFCMMVTPGIIIPQGQYVWIVLE
jgi:hypothetical protein